MMRTYFDLFSSGRVTAGDFDGLSPCSRAMGSAGVDPSFAGIAALRVHLFRLLLQRAEPACHASLAARTRTARGDLASAALRRLKLGPQPPSDLNSRRPAAARSRNAVTMLNRRPPPQRYPDRNSSSASFPVSSSGRR